MHTPTHCHATRAGLQGAIVAAHAEWSRKASAADGSTAPVTEEGLGGEDFTLVGGLDEDEPAADPAVTATPAGVPHSPQQCDAAFTSASLQMLEMTTLRQARMHPRKNDWGPLLHNKRSQVVARLRVIGLTTPFRNEHTFSPQPYPNGRIS